MGWPDDSVSGRWEIRKDTLKLDEAILKGKSFVLRNFQDSLWKIRTERIRRK